MAVPNQIKTIQGRFRLTVVKGVTQIAAMSDKFCQFICFGDRQHGSNESIFIN